MSACKVYRVEQKSWCQVQRMVLPSHSQPRPAMPGWCLTKQSLSSAQRCTLINTKVKEGKSSMVLLADPQSK